MPDNYSHQSALYHSCHKFNTTSSHFYYLFVWMLNRVQRSWNSGNNLEDHLVRILFVCEREQRAEVTKHELLVLMLLDNIQDLFVDCDLVFPPLCTDSVLLQENVSWRH